MPRIQLRPTLNKRAVVVLAALLITGAALLAANPYFIEEMLVAVLIVAVPFVVVLLILVALAAIQEAGRFGILFVKESSRPFGPHSKSRGELIEQMVHR